MNTKDENKYPLVKDCYKCKILAYGDPEVAKVLKIERYKNNRYFNELKICNEILKRGTKEDEIKGLAHIWKIKVSWYGEPVIIMKFYDGGSLHMQIQKRLE